MVELAHAHRHAPQVAISRPGPAFVMQACLHLAEQVNLMRFSTAIHSDKPGAEPRRDEAPREMKPQPLAAPAQDLPDDLDARVRLVGEWQLGEG